MAREDRLALSRLRLWYCRQDSRVIAMAMNVQSKNCYDVFNDYLGLSNVVGGQDESRYWMESVHGSESGSHYKLQAAMSELECRLLTSREGYTCKASNISNVERLFGRGAVLQKTDFDIINSRVSLAAQRRSPNQTPTRNLSSSPLYQTNFHQDANDCKDSIQLALDAILRKYNYLQQPYLQPIQLNDKDINDGRYNKYVPTQPESHVVGQHRNDLHEVSSPTTSEESDGFFRDGSYPVAKSTFQAPVNRFIGCSFCKNNKEVREWFMSHQLKDSVGRVTCPVLRSYECPLCDATGDNAHTVGHCPLNPNRHSSLPLAVRSKTNATGKKKPT